MRYISTTLSLSRKYLLKPSSLDDICYTLYTLFKDKAMSIAYEKPNCSHMFIVGTNFEIRLFVNSLREAQINFLIDSGPTLSSKLLSLAKNTFTNIDKTFSKFCEKEGKVHILLRSTFRYRNIGLEEVEETLKDIGIAICSRELHTVSDIVLTVVRGKTVGKNLKRYDITVTILENSEAELSISVETDLNEDKAMDPLDQLIEIQNLLYNIVEVFIVNNKKAPK